MERKDKMNIYIVLLAMLSSLLLSTANAVEGVIEDGKWSMLEEPLQVGNMGLVFDASVKAEDYESGPIRDVTFACEYGKPELTIRFIGENLSANNGNVVYSIDDGPERSWDMRTEFESGVSASERRGIC